MRAVIFRELPSGVEAEIVVVGTWDAAEPSVGYPGRWDIDGATIDGAEVDLDADERAAAEVALAEADEEAARQHGADRAEYLADIRRAYGMGW